MKYCKTILIWQYNIYINMTINGASKILFLDFKCQLSSFDQYKTVQLLLSLKKLSGIGSWQMFLFKYTSKLAILVANKKKILCPFINPSLIHMCISIIDLYHTFLANRKFLWRCWWRPYLIKGMEIHKRKDIKYNYIYY